LAQEWASRRAFPQCNDFGFSFAKGKEESNLNSANNKLGR